MGSTEPVESVVVELRRRAGYEFVVRVEGIDAPELVTDERPPVGGGRGPNPASLLAAAVANCLGASLLFCLEKARVPVGGIRCVARASYARNERGRLRIGSIAVEIAAEVAAEHLERFERCRAIFEDYCVITESVRRGVPVEVSVESASG